MGWFRTRFYRGIVKERIIGQLLHGLFQCLAAELPTHCLVALRVRPRDHLPLLQCDLSATKAIISVVQPGSPELVLKLALFLDLELAFKFKQLPLEARVREYDAPLRLAELKGLEHAHAVVLHEVGHYTRRTTGHPRVATVCLG